MELDRFLSERAQNADGRERGVCCLREFRVCRKCLKSKAMKNEVGLDEAVEIQMSKLHLGKRIRTAKMTRSRIV
jgi:Ribosomal protein S14p/S29e